MTHDLEGVRLHIGWKADLDWEVGRDVVIHLRKKNVVNSLNLQLLYDSELNT